MFVYIRATHFSDESAEGFPVLHARIYVYSYIRATRYSYESAAQGSVF